MVATPIPGQRPGTSTRKDPLLDTPTTTRAIWHYFKQAGWAAVCEVGIPAPRGSLAKPRRVDVLAVKLGRRPGMGPVELLAVEVKTTLADYKADVANPDKQAPARALAHRHAYAAPAGLIDPDTLPDGSGLLEVAPGGAVTWARRAPYPQNAARAVPGWLTVNLAYRAGDAEAKAAGWTGITRDQDPAVLRGEVDRLNRLLDSARNKTHTLERKLDALRTVLAAAGGVPCRYCGTLLKPKGWKSGWVKEWAHVDADAGAACDEQRNTDTVEAAKARFACLSETSDTREAAERMFPGQPWRWFYCATPAEPVDAEDLVDV